MGVRAPQSPRRKPASKNEIQTDAARFASRVETALAESEVAKAHWGIVVANEATGEILFERDAGHLFVPASNTKIFTSAFALAELGPDHRFRTTIETAGTAQPNGHLVGDIVFIGRGDPDISNRKFPYEHNAEREGPAEKVLAEMADQVVARGVKEIDGDVIADDSYFAFDPYPEGWTNGDLYFGFGAPVRSEMADQVVARGVKEIDGDVIADDSYFAFDPYPEGWTNGDLYFGFGAPVSAISLDDNTLTVTVQPGAKMGDAPAISVSPLGGMDTFGHEI